MKINVNILAIIAVTSSVHTERTLLHTLAESCMKKAYADPVELNECDMTISYSQTTYYKKDVPDDSCIQEVINEIKKGVSVSSIDEQGWLYELYLTHF